MPLTNCSANGTSGWKWGNAGHCYTGPGAKKKAIKQGLAEGGGHLDASLMDEIEEENLWDDMIGDKDLSMFTRMELSTAKTLTTKKRKDLPDDDFGIIIDGKKKFPLNDAAHVRNALSRLPDSNLTPAQKATVMTKIRKKAKKFGIDISKTDKG